MKCSDVDRILPDIIDADIVDGVRFHADRDAEFQSHLRTCPHCSELFSDLKLIASEARRLPSTEEPDDRVWLRIAAELRAEGLIRDPEHSVARPVLVPARQRRWNAFWLAPVAVAILATGSYLLTHKPASPAVQEATNQAGEPQPIPREPQQSNTASVSQTPETPALPKAQAPPERADISPPAGAEDQQLLSEVSSRAPTMRATYENQLQAVNNEIRETQAYINMNPGDADARQHLLEVYQQKSMLYQMALDRIQ